MSPPSPLLGPAEIRTLADRLGVRPTKMLGQNFGHDGGTVRKIVRQSGVVSGERVVAAWASATRAGPLLAA